MPQRWKDLLRRRRDGGGLGGFALRVMSRFLRELCQARHRVIRPSRIHKRRDPLRTFGQVIGHSIPCGQPAPELAPNQRRWHLR